ncbi:retinol dehydrogenase 13-like protein [Leptotrombidium deliense]|uniref:Retinol dehydrogenase 13-like protein n=1 Tax=Leptotrombidium deliense TaxID=299467 RepID=A0A443S845_9ACAR|nr:retinol dehydrogenase 13-like protein [Leptotrombidium deliense]
MPTLIDYIFYFIILFSELIINPVRHFFKIGYCKASQRLDGQIAVISDANSSIGKAVAIRLAQSGRFSNSLIKHLKRFFLKIGAKVVLACSDMAQGERTYYEIKWRVANATLALMYLDLSSFKSVRNFSNKMKNQFEKIDILVNCSQVSSSAYIKTEDDFEIHFANNYLSHFLLTMLLLDSLKRSECAKVINITSIHHLLGKMHFDDISLKTNYGSSKAFNQSQLAQVLFTKELAKRCSSVSVFAVDPGFVASYESVSLYKLVANFRLCAALKHCTKTILLRTPFQGAQTIFHCIFDQNTDKHSGKYFRYVIKVIFIYND